MHDADQFPRENGAGAGAFLQALCHRDPQEWQSRGADKGHSGGGVGLWAVAAGGRAAAVNGHPVNPSTPALSHGSVGILQQNMTCCAPLGQSRHRSAEKHSLKTLKN